MKKAKSLQNSCMSVQDYEEMMEIKGKLNGLWAEEEKYWYQMTMVNWLNMGDKTQKISLSCNEKGEAE